MHHVIRQFLPGLPAEFPGHPPGRLPADHDVTSQPPGRIAPQVKGKHIGGLRNLHPFGVQFRNPPVVHHKHADLGCLGPDHRDRSTDNSLEPGQVDRHCLLPIADFDRNGPVRLGIVGNVRHVRLRASPIVRDYARIGRAAFLLRRFPVFAFDATEKPGYDYAMSHASIPTHWQLRTRQLEVMNPGGRFQRPLVMGIVNVTPDSFSDGGRHADVEAGVAHGLALVAAGADLLDVGGESTRPFSEPVPADEELRRVVEVVGRLAAESGVPVSIDTSKGEVAARAVEAGAEIINDVTGLAGDPAMLAVARDSRAGICAMHMQGTPRTMQLNPSYGDVVVEVHSYLARRRDIFLAAGISLERICLDPGIGFGKTHAHNQALMARVAEFGDLGTPILVGHSRKGFINRLIEQALGRPATMAERDAATAAAACGLAAAGVQVVRVHAVGLVRSALAVFAATAPAHSAGRVK